MAKLRSVRVAITFQSIKSQKSPSPRITHPGPSPSRVLFRVCKAGRHSPRSSSTHRPAHRAVRRSSPRAHEVVWSARQPDKSSSCMISRHAISEGSLTPGFESLLLWLSSGFHQPLWLPRARGSVLCPCCSCPGPSLWSRPEFVHHSFLPP